MKKAIAILLVVVMALSLCACDGDIKKAIIGRWETQYLWNDGTEMVGYITFYQGGTGEKGHYPVNDPDNIDSYYRAGEGFTWEVKDGVINIDVNIFAIIRNKLAVPV